MSGLLLAKGYPVFMEFRMTAMDDDNGCPGLGTGCLL